MNFYIFLYLYNYEKMIVALVSYYSMMFLSDLLCCHL